MQRDLRSRDRPLLERVERLGKNSCLDTYEEDAPKHFFTKLRLDKKKYR